MDNVYHPHQKVQYSTVFRYNPALNRVEYFSWGQAAWDSVGNVFTPYRQPRKQLGFIRERAKTSNGYSLTTYGKTYLEPIVES